MEFAKRGFQPLGRNILYINNLWNSVGKAEKVISG